MFGYSTQLRSMSSGRATYTMEPSHFERVPTKIQEKIFEANSNRRLWIQVARGSLTVNGTTLNTSDGAAIINETSLNIQWTANSEFLLFDMV